MKKIALIILASIGLYGQWITGYYEMGTGVPQISDIPWNYYTQIIAFAAVPNSDGTINMYGLSASGNNALIASRPAGKKVLAELADTGCCWGQGTSPSTVATYVTNIVNLVNSYGFDGVDLDWERGVDAAQYADLITRLRNAMPNKLITMSVNGDFVSVAGANQSKRDQRNAMCYYLDFAAGSTSWYNGSIHEAPLQWSCSLLTGRLTAAGVPAAKISAAIPFYGRKWTGCSQVLVSPCSMQTYELYRDMVSDTTRWQSQYRHYDTQFMSNYLSIPSLNEFHSYNGVEFMPDVAAWRKASGYGGISTFSIGYEYLSGQTCNARYPLSSALYNAVFGSGGGSVPSGTPPTISTSSLPSGIVGAAYSQTLSASGTTPISWSLAGGSLPAGLSLNSSGAITGTPTTAGTSNFTAQASNSAGSTTKSLSITINAPAPTGTAPTITTSSLASGTVGTAYSQTLTVTGTTPITWGPATLSLPAGLTWNASTATISGTPTTAATGTYTFTATNSFGTATKALSIAINAAAPTAPAPTSTSPYAYWKLNDGSGSTAADSSGNGKTATLFNNPSWQSGCVASGCLSFNGSNQYGSAALDLSDTSAITLSFWMNWTAYADDDKFAMEFSPNFNFATTGFMVDPNSSYNGGGQFEVGLQGDGGYNQVLFARPTPGWHHYAFVFNKAAVASNEVTPYVDGIAVPYTKPTIAENTNNFGSDTLFFMSPPGSALVGNGALDEVQVYKTALSASQIMTLAKLYTAPVTSPTTPAPSPTTTSDTIPPTVSITSPGGGQWVAVNSQITLTVAASDNVGVTNVQYVLDGGYLGNPVTTGGSFSMGWTASVSKGWHTLTAVASDKAVNITTSAPVTFRVTQH